MSFYSNQFSNLFFPLSFPIFFFPAMSVGWKVTLSMARPRQEGPAETPAKVLRGPHQRPHAGDEGGWKSCDKSRARRERQNQMREVEVKMGDEQKWLWDIFLFPLCFCGKWHQVLYGSSPSHQNFGYFFWPWKFRLHHGDPKHFDKSNVLWCPLVDNGDVKRPDFEHQALMNLYRSSWFPSAQGSGSERLQCQSQTKSIEVLY